MIRQITRNGTATQTDPVQQVLDMLARVDVPGLEARLEELQRERAEAVAAIDERIATLKRLLRMVAPAEKRAEKQAGEAPRTRREPSIRTRVLQYLEHAGAARSAVIAADLQCQTHSVQCQISELLKARLVVRQADGRIALVRAKEDD